MSDAAISPDRAHRPWRNMLDLIVSVALLIASGSVVWANVLKPYFRQASVGVKLPKTPLEVKGLPFYGELSAKVGVIEYSDFQCPFCIEFARDVLPTLERDYINSGKAIFIFRQLPLTSIHPLADTAARAAVCAGEQNQFWRMHNRLFEPQGHIDEAAVRTSAQSIGLTIPLFSDCISTTGRARVDADVASARALGIASTPTFLVGLMRSDGTMLVTTTVTGRRPLNDFRAAIESAFKR